MPQTKCIAVKSVKGQCRCAMRVPLEIYNSMKEKGLVKTFREMCKEKGAQLVVAGHDYEKRHLKGGLKMTDYSALRDPYELPPLEYLDEPELGFLKFDKENLKYLLIAAGAATVGGLLINQIKKAIPIQNETTKNLIIAGVGVLGAMALWKKSAPIAVGVGLAFIIPSVEGVIEGLKKKPEEQAKEEEKKQTAGYFPTIRLPELGTTEVRESAERDFGGTTYTPLSADEKFFIAPY